MTPLASDDRCRGLATLLGLLLIRLKQLLAALVLQQQALKPYRVKRETLGAGKEADSS